MKLDLGGLLRAGNNHFVGNSGLFVTAVAGAVHIGADLMTKGVLRVPLGVAVVFGDLDSMTVTAASTGALAAYFGRPKTIAADPKPSTPPGSPITRISQAFERAASTRGARLITGRSESAPPPSARSGGAIAPASPVGTDVSRPPQLLAAALLHVAGTAGGRSLNMANTWEGKLADGIVSFYDKNQPALIALLNSKNVTVADFVENAAQALIAKNPMVALVLGGEVKSLTPAIVSFFGSEEAAAVAALDAALHAEAVKLGG